MSKKCLIPKEGKCCCNCYAIRKITPCYCSAYLNIKGYICVAFPEGNNEVTYKEDVHGICDLYRIKGEDVILYNIKELCDMYNCSDLEGRQYPDCDVPALYRPNICPKRKNKI